MKELGVTASQDFFQLFWHFVCLPLSRATDDSIDRYKYNARGGFLYFVRLVVGADDNFFTSFSVTR